MQNKNPVSARCCEGFSGTELGALHDERMIISVEPRSAPGIQYDAKGICFRYARFESFLPVWSAMAQNSSGVIFGSIWQPGHTRRQIRGRPTRAARAVENIIVITGGTGGCARIHRDEKII